MGLSTEQVQKLDHDMDNNHTEVVILTRQDANRIAADTSMTQQASTQNPWLCPRANGALLDGTWGCAKTIYSNSYAHQFVNTNWGVPTVLTAYDAFHINELRRKIGGHGTKIRYTVMNGKEYIIISGRPGLRNILKGTRYLAQNPKIITAGIGKYGAQASAIKGFKISFVVAVGIEVVEWLASNESVMSDLFTGVGVELVKAGIASAIGFAVTAGIGALTASAVIPAAIGIAFVFVVSYALNVIDNENGIKTGLKEQVRQYTDYTIDNMNKFSDKISKIDASKIKNSIQNIPNNLVDALLEETEQAAKEWFKKNITDQILPNLPFPDIGNLRLPKL